MNCQKKITQNLESSAQRKWSWKSCCQRNLTLTRFSEEEDARLRAEMKIVLENKYKLMKLCHRMYWMHVWSQFKPSGFCSIFKESRALKSFSYAVFRVVKDNWKWYIHAVEKHWGYWISDCKVLILAVVQCKRKRWETGQES